MYWIPLKPRFVACSNPVVVPSTNAERREGFFCVCAKKLLCVCHLELGRAESPTSSSLPRLRESPETAGGVEVFRSFCSRLRFLGRFKGEGLIARPSGESGWHRRSVEAQEDVFKDVSLGRTGVLKGILRFRGDYWKNPPRGRAGRCLWRRSANCLIK